MTFFIGLMQKTQHHAKSIPKIFLLLLHKISPLPQNSSKIILIWHLRGTYSPYNNVVGDNYYTCAFLIRFYADIPNMLSQVSFRNTIVSSRKLKIDLPIKIIIS